MWFKIGVPFAKKSMFERGPQRLFTIGHSERYCLSFQIGKLRVGFREGHCWLFIGWLKTQCENIFGHSPYKWAKTIGVFGSIKRILGD